MSWQDVGSVAELDRNGHLVARVGEREIGVVAVNGEARGPQPLSAPRRPTLPRNGQGARRWRPRPLRVAGASVLRCPWHGWEFDPVTATASTTTPCGSRSIRRRQSAAACSIDIRGNPGYLAVDGIEARALSPRCAGELCSTASSRCSRRGALRIDLVRALAELDSMVTSEGTIYPLLSVAPRRARRVELAGVDLGPPRRYYRLTKAAGPRSRVSGSSGDGSATLSITS